MQLDRRNLKKIFAVAMVVSERNQVFEGEELDQPPQVMVRKHSRDLSSPAHRRKLMRPF